MATENGSTSATTAQDTMEQQAAADKGKGKAPQQVDVSMDEDEDESEEESAPEDENIEGMRSSTSPSHSSAVGAHKHRVEEADDDNMEEIDTDNIIGRRTRGKTID